MTTLPETLVRHTSDGTDRLTILQAAHGWEIRRDRDGRVVKVVHHSDWHRVEAAMRAFERGD